MKQKLNGGSKTKIEFVQITHDEAEQRVDNYLIRRLKGLPRARIYRILRKGEVRVNQKRSLPSYRLQLGDIIRIPPIMLAEQAKAAPPGKQTQAWLLDRIIYEDDEIMILNKPPEISVHAGSSVRMGVIEILKFAYPQWPQLELAHRLDSDTSGCLLLAKKKRVLRELHALLREGKIKKIYWALTRGIWKKSELRVEAALHKNYTVGGKHVVSVQVDGKPALSVFEPLQNFNQHASLMAVKLHTGRTHQIRVHAAYCGHQIAGDNRYGDREFNKSMDNLGLQRLFLHAYSLDFILPSSQKHISVQAQLDDTLNTVLAACKTQFSRD